MSPILGFYLFIYWTIWLMSPSKASKILFMLLCCVCSF